VRHAARYTNDSSPVYHADPERFRRPAENVGNDFLRFVNDGIAGKIARETLGSIRITDRRSGS